MKCFFSAWITLVALPGSGCVSIAATRGQAPEPSRCTTREALPRHRYLLYEHRGVHRGRAVSDHAARGYRLLFSNRSTSLFEQLPAGAGIPEYVALDAEAPLEQALNDAGAGGFRLLPDTRRIMEKEKGSHSRYEYRVASSRAVPDMRTALRILQRHAMEMARDGYRIVDFARSYEHDDYLEVDIAHDVVIGERPLDSEAAGTARHAGPHSLTLLAPGDRSLQRPLSEHAARGYRLTLVGPAPMLLLEPAPPTEARAEYLVVLPRGPSQTNTGRTLEAPMNAAAARGFRMRRDGVFLSRTRGVLSIPTFSIASIGVVMEKTADGAAVSEFRILDAVRFSTLQRELQSALAEAFVPIGMRATVNATYIVLERPRGRCSRPDL